jgi:adenylate cyclase class IV
MTVLIEVERKDAHKKKQTGPICMALFDKGFQAHPAKQKQYYLNSANPKVNERVRKEKTPDGVTYTHTIKHDLAGAANTNRENEVAIDKATFKHLKATRQMTAFGVRVMVRKKRVHFYGSYQGYKVTVCLDQAWGPMGIWLGRFVEFETMVATDEEVPAAEAVLAELSAEIMPEGCARERRGYKTLALVAIRKFARRLRKKTEGEE